MNNLPSEVIFHILEYLSFEDRHRVARVNRLAHYSTLHPTFLKKEQFVFGEMKFDGRLILQQRNNFTRMLMKSKRKIINLQLTFDYVAFDLNNLSLYTNLGERLKCLCLIGLDLFSDFHLDSITSFCCHLETLSLKEIKSMKLTDKSRKPLLLLKRLSFCQINSFSDKYFNIIVKCAPNLKELAIYKCSIYMQPKYIIYHSYDNDTDYNKEFMFTLVNITNYLSTAESINSVELEPYTKVIILDMPKPINLRCLSFSSIDAYPTEVIENYNQKIVSILGTYTSLHVLDIECCPCFLVDAISKLINLEHLNILCRYCFRHVPSFDDTQIIYKVFFTSLINMKRIKNFSLKNWFNIPQLNPIESFAIPGCTLRSLRSLKSPIDNCSRIINFGKNLTTLEILNGEILLESDFILLFESLTALRVLSIDKCIGMNDTVMLNSPISNIKGLTSLKILGSNLSYQCLPLIQLMDLKYLHFDNLSLRQYNHRKNVLNFKKCLQKFGSSVPALTECELCFRNSPFLLTKFKPSLHTYFKRIKVLVVN